MNKSRKSIYIAALIICFLICIGILGALFLLNRDNSRALVRESQTQQSDHRSQGTRDSDSATLQQQSGSTVAFHSLADLVEQSSGVFDSKRALLRVVDSATEDVLLRIFHEVLEVPNILGSRDAKFWMLSIVLTKLISVNETKAPSLIEQLDERDAESVLYGVMQEWNPVHTDEAIVFLSALGMDIRHLGLRGLIAGGNFLSRAELFQIGTELGYEESYINGLLDQRQLAHQSVSLDDLETEFENADLDDFFQLWQLEQIAVSYVLAEGLDSLPTVLELFDRVPTGNVSELFGSMVDSRRSDVVSSISTDDPANVFEFVLQLDENIDVELLSAVSQVWFASDPDALWNRLQGEDVKNFQVEITEDVIGHWARTDPHLALVSLNHFPAEYHDHVYLHIAQDLSGDSPLEALEILPLTSIWPEIPPDQLPAGDFSLRASRTDFLISRIISKAVETDPIATIEWLNSDTSQLDDSTRQQYLDTVFESWARSDPETAFEIALQTPLKEGTTALEATVVQWLAYRDVDHAIALLPRVREGESKLEVYKRVAGQLEEEDRISEAIQLGDQLPEHQREGYLKRLSLSVAHRSPFNRLVGGIRELPSKNLQSYAARSAIMFSGMIVSPELTDNEKDQLKDFLTDEDKRTVEMLENVDLDSLKED